jgi:hypothetical protein
MRPNIRGNSSVFGKNTIKRRGADCDRFIQAELKDIAMAFQGHKKTPFGAAQRVAFAPDRF